MPPRPPLARQREPVREITPEQFGKRLHLVCEQRTQPLPVRLGHAGAAGVAVIDPLTQLDNWLGEGAVDEVLAPDLGE